jgi:Domain of unknown function (DUF4421)
MKHCVFYRILFIVIYVPGHSAVFGQFQGTDSNYIRAFTKTNVIEIYPAIYSTHFNFTHSGQRKNDYSLVANSSAHIGINLNYKWLSLRYSWAMPGTELDKNVKLQYTSLGLNFRIRQMRFHPFYESYNGLLIPKQKRNTDSFTIFRGIQFTSVGLDYYFFTNTRLFSFSAARSFSVSQVKGAGSVFSMITPAWQKINWKDPSRDLLTDSSTFVLLSQDPEWVSLVIRVGYTYNFILQKGKWIIAPAVLTGAGLTKEINIAGSKLKPVTNFQVWLNAGYNGHDYYFYLHAWWNDLRTNLLIKNMNQINTSFSFTAGYRFHNFRRKILGLL